jgi:uncharacterized protein (DUF1800 family)
MGLARYFAPDPAAMTGKTMAAAQVKSRFILLAAMPVMLGIMSSAYGQMTLTTRQQVQHVLRRFSFSAAPEQVTSVVNSGISAWLTAQLAAPADDPSSYLETLPTGPYTDTQIFERTLIQHWVLTQWQLQAKVELHWLDHFSVSLNGVGNPAMMDHYIKTIRANALGNFATLLTAVSEESAMMYWLSNNGNTPPKPNENFGRELMQLYSTGEYTLDANGNITTGTGGTPLLNYTETDVVHDALAMTGYSVIVNSTNANPLTNFSVTFNASGHYQKDIGIQGHFLKVGAAIDPIATVCAFLAAQPQTAIYESKQLLQRFVTENPSATYVSNIAAVWTKYEKAPNQIAEVITAIINDPEFNSAYQAMQKQPVELVIGALRQLPGTLQLVPASSSNGNNAIPPGASVLYELNQLNQEPYYPPNVFGFYPPGHLDNLVNAHTILNKSWVFANYTGATAANNDTYLDLATLRTRIGATTNKAIAAYLLDALVDGGSTGLQQLIPSYLGKTPSDQRVLGAIWLLLNSPEYEVN